MESQTDLDVVSFNSSSLDLPSQQQFDFKTNSIKYLVGVAMRDDESLRLHKNRNELYEKVCNLCEGEELSFPPFESVTRAQRYLWSKGLYHPKSLNDLYDWMKIQRITESHYREHYGNPFPSSPGGAV